MNTLDNISHTMPSMYCDFSHHTPPSLLCSRASVAHDWDKGKLAAANTPRRSYNRLGILGEKGLLQESAAVNILPNSLNTSGSVEWGSQGNGFTLTPSTVKGPVESTVTTVVFNGSENNTTISGVFNRYIGQLVAGRTYVGSYYIRNKTPNIDFILSTTLHDWVNDFNTGVYESRNNTPSAGSAGRFYPVGDGWWRVEIIFRPTVQGGSYPGGYLGAYFKNIDNGRTLPAGLTIELCGYQVEDATGYERASSFISGAGASTARAAEVNSIDIKDMLGNGDFTIAAAVGVDASLDGVILQLSDGTSTINGVNVISFRTNAGTHSVVSGASETLMSANNGTPKEDFNHVVGFAFSKSNASLNMYFNGVHATTNAAGNNTVNVNAITKLYYGLVNGSTQSVKCALLKRLAIWPRQLTKNELNAVCGIL